MIITFSKKNKLVLYICSGILIAFFIISLVSLRLNNKKKFLYVFPSAEEKQYVLETRYLAKYNKKTSELSAYEYYLNKYVDDLLLGSSLERTKLIFPYGTKANSCFLRDDVLYVDLSKDFLTLDNETVDLTEGVNLFNDNIKKNFKKVKKIELFVDGIYAYEKENLK